MASIGPRMACSPQLWCIAASYFAIFIAKNICAGKKIVLTIKITTIKGKTSFENACSCAEAPLRGVPTMAAV